MIPCSFFQPLFAPHIRALVQFLFEIRTGLLLLVFNTKCESEIFS